MDKLERNNGFYFCNSKRGNKKSFYLLFISLFFWGVFNAFALYLSRRFGCKNATRCIFQELFILFIGAFERLNILRNIFATSKVNSNLTNVCLRKLN